MTLELATKIGLDLPTPSLDDLSFLSNDETQVLGLDHQQLLGEPFIEAFL